MQNDAALFVVLGFLLELTKMDFGGYCQLTVLTERSPAWCVYEIQLKRHSFLE